MKRKALYALVALTLGGAAVAHAQDYSNWYLAPRIGAVIPDGDRQTDTSLLQGLSIGFWVNPNFAASFDYTISDADFEENSGRDGKEWESVGLGFSGRWFFGDEGRVWRPYAMGGIGALRHAPYSGIVQQAGWDPMLTLGGGIQYNRSERMAFRVELAARYDRDNNSIPGNTGFTDALVNVGAVFNFGSAAPAKATEKAVTPPPAPDCRSLDDDRDGVNNCDDRCPQTAAGTVVGPDGCPQKVVIDLRGINFKFDRPKVGEKNIAPTLKEPTSDSVAILDQAVDTLKRYPDVRVEIDGHTDSVGTDAYNQGLSERRAKIVYDYLTSHGVSASRLDGPKGFGEAKPIDNNSTKEGRQRNRRVEMSVQNPK